MIPTTSHGKSLGLSPKQEAVNVCKCSNQKLSPKFLLMMTFSWFIDWLFGNTFPMELFSPGGDLQFFPLSSRLVELQCHARSARSPKHSAAAEASIAMSKTCQTRLCPPYCSSSPQKKKFGITLKNSITWYPNS